MNAYHSARLCVANYFFHSTTTAQVLQEVHPHVSIDSDALTYLEALLYHLLAKICSSSPTSVQDVRSACNGYLSFLKLAVVNMCIQNFELGSLGLLYVRRSNSFD